MRGGERVLDVLARAIPDAEIYTLFHRRGTTTPAIDGLKVRASPLNGLPGVQRHYRKLLPLYPWAIRKFEIKGYDLVLSVSHAVAKNVRTEPGIPHLCYCLTPMRYVWDQADAYLGHGLRRRVADPLVRALRRHDVAHSGPNEIDRFVAISSSVAERIQHRYERGANVVHPPVDCERIRPNEKEPEDFYLLIGGFVPYKRDALAIEAFRGRSDRLVIVGDGPSRRKLQARAPQNVEFRGRVSDEEVTSLLQRCRALVYPQEEHFGIAAVEAQAAAPSGDRRGNRSSRRGVHSISRGAAKEEGRAGALPGSSGSRRGRIHSSSPSGDRRSTRCSCRRIRRSSHGDSRGSPGS